MSDVPSGPPYKVRRLLTRRSLSTEKPLHNVIMSIQCTNAVIASTSILPLVGLYVGFVFWNMKLKTYYIDIETMCITVLL